MIYNKMRSEHQRLEQEITSIQSQLKELPEGKLICARNGNYTKWYQSDGQQSTYISKKNKHLAEQLAAKKYLTLRCEELLHEQKAIDFYLRHHAADVGNAEQLISEGSTYSNLLAPYFTPLSRELHDWMIQPYDHNPTFPDQCIHKTSSGIFVRSKSESLIATFLHMNKIPFRYECALSLEDVTIYPDFTIRHPQTGQYFYWEHFGLMDNPNYCKSTFSKLHLYTSNGILPSVHLLTTYETKDHPLNAEIVENLIQFYFL